MKFVDDLAIGLFVILTLGFGGALVHASICAGFDISMKICFGG
jgi:hypothetical protein